MLLIPFYIKNCMQYFLVAPDKIKALQSPIRGVRGYVYVGDINYEYKSIKQFKELSLQKCSVNSPTAAYKRELYDQGKLQTNPEKFGGAADYDLYCKLADEDIFIFPVNEWLGYYYRWHEKQCTWSVVEEKKKTNYDKIIQEHWRKKWTL